MRYEMRLLLRIRSCHKSVFFFFFFKKKVSLDYHYMCMIKRQCWWLNRTNRDTFRLAIASIPGPSFPHPTVVGEKPLAGRIRGRRRGGCSRTCVMEKRCVILPYIEICTIVSLRLISWSEMFSLVTHSCLTLLWSPRVSQKPPLRGGSVTVLASDFCVLMRLRTDIQGGQWALEIELLPSRLWSLRIRQLHRCVDEVTWVINGSLWGSITTSKIFWSREDFLRGSSRMCVEGGCEHASKKHWLCLWCVLACFISIFIIRFSLRMFFHLTLNKSSTPRLGILHSTAAFFGAWAFDS